MLLSLHLKNFMRHKEFEASFDPKETLIVGDNWRGKTTLFKAILFALFGPVAVPGGAKAIQRRGTTDKPSVTLVFAVGPNTYTVIRKQTVARLLKNNKLEATGPANVTAAIEELLGMPAKLFGELRVSPQDEVGAILTLGVGRLNQIIGQITKAELIEKVLELLKARIQTVDAELNVLPTYDLEALKTGAAAKVSSLAREHEVLIGQQAALAQVTEDLDNSTVALNDLNTKVKAYYATLEQQTKATIHLEHLKADLATARNDATVPIPVSTSDYYPEVHRLEQQAQALRDTVAQRKVHSDRVQQLSKTLLTAQQEQEFAEEVAHRAPGIKNPGIVASQMSLVLKMRQDLGALNEKARATRKAADGSICPTCLRPFEDADLDAAEALAELAHQEMQMCFNQLQEEEDKYEKFTAKQRAYDEAQQQISGAISEVQKLQVDIEATKANLQGPDPVIALPAIAAASQSARETYNSILAAETNKAEAQRKVNKLKPKLQLLEIELAGLQLTPLPGKAQIDTAEESVARYSALKEGATKQVATLTANYAAAYNEYTRLAADLQAAETAERQRKDRQVRAKHMDTLTTYLKRAHKDFVARTWASILDYASMFVSQCTDGGITRMTIKDGSKFRYVENTEDMPITSASGLQRAIMGVGVRMALAEAIRAPAGVLLLDEVTAGATAENSLAMAQALSQVGPQVVLVSHRQSDAAVAQKVIQV
jgi:DNA repair exonuclease SbcCD ATPase subunit